MHTAVDPAGARRLARLGLACALAVLIAGCTQNGEPAPAPAGSPTGATAEATTQPSPTATAATEATSPAAPTPAFSTPATSSSEPVAAADVASDLERPWDVAFTPDDRIFVTEQDSGRLVELSNGEAVEVQRFDVDSTGEGGLLGLAVAPDYPESGRLYAYLSTAEDNRVVRFRPGEQPDPVVTGIPHGSIHNGGRIAFGPDGLLYIGTGDAGESARAQDPGSLGGKILRVRPDGTVPDDNPTMGDNGSASAVYSLGHRNVQGLAWDAGGQLYASELGPDADDEINRITAGGNYGWPDVTGTVESEAYIDPIFVRQPPEASWSGLAYSADPAVPQWAGDLLVASLRGERLWDLELAADGTIADADDLFAGTYGRLRTATFAPDGSLWLVTSNTDIYGSPSAGDDRIIRLAPQR